MSVIATDIETAPIEYTPIKKNDIYVDSYISSATGVYCLCKPVEKIVVYHGKGALLAHFKTKCHQKWLAQLNTNPNEHNVQLCKECVHKDTTIRDLKIQVTNLQNKMVDYNLKEKRIKELTDALAEMRILLQKERITVSALQSKLVESSHVIDMEEDEYFDTENNEVEVD